MRRGFTLAEVMVALGLITIAVLTIIAAFTGALQLSSKSSEITAATGVGQDFLEAIRDAGYDFVPDGTYTFDGRRADPAIDGFPPDPYPVAQVDGRDYSLKVRVAPKGATLKIVTVEVFWGNQSRIALETFFYP
ncbi:MAG: hypothetical protein KC910_34070 [Candidatus Eremiobacteraeota bacterium]|nr:hypothetical protein [Candidatus Eremiobacteraeota bacterium]